MDTEKQWDAFEKNDTQFRKSESVQQDIQQILDTVTQIKTDVDQLKGENTEAAGPVDTEPALSAPEESNQPPMAPPEDMSGAAPGGEIPQEPMGDLMAQPEDGAATPSPEMAAPPANDIPGQMPDDSVIDRLFGGIDEGPAPEAVPEENDESILLEAAQKVKDPTMKQQLLAIVYQAIEEQKAPPAPPIEEMAPAPEEILAAAMDANGDGMISEEEVEPMMRSATDTVQCDKPPADQITSTVQNSDDEEKKDDEKKDDKKEESEDDKSERPKKEEPGVNDGLPSEEEDKDSTEELPEVTEVQIETSEDMPEGDQTSEEKADAIDSIIDSVLEDAKEKIKEQVVEAVDGIDAEHSPFILSTEEMIKSRRAGGSHRAFKPAGPIKKSIEWPEDVTKLSLEDKCRYFAKSFSQMDNNMQDSVITLMDMKLGSETTSSIFKSEGMDLDAYYEPVMKAAQDHEGFTSGETVSGNGAVKEASEDNGGMTESCEESTVQECDSIQNDFKPHKVVKPGEIKPTIQANEKTPKFSSPGPNGWASNDSTIQNSDDTVQESVTKSAGVGIHIPSVSEMMSFKKSGTSMYTSISREAAEPHGIVDMGNEQSIPSVKDMFAKRFGKA